MNVIEDLLGNPAWQGISVLVAIIIALITAYTKKKWAFFLYPIIAIVALFIGIYIGAERAISRQESRSNDESDIRRTTEALRTQVALLSATNNDEPANETSQQSLRETISTQNTTIAKTVTIPPPVTAVTAVTVVAPVTAVTAVTVVAPTVQPTLTPDPVVLFEDRFEEGLKPDWQQITGEWSVLDGQLLPLTFISDRARIFVGSSDWQDYTLTFDIAGLGVNFSGDAVNNLTISPRFQEEGNQMLFTLEKRSSSCARVLNGEKTEFKSVSHRIDGSTQVRIRAIGESYEFSVGGARICSINDNNFLNGGIKLESFSDFNRAKVKIDNFKVSK